MNSSFSWEAFDSMPIVGILRNVPPQHMDKLAEVYFDAGLTTLEITMNSARATETISSLVHSFGGRLNVGAGTVCTLQDLDEALHAGAQFIVTPVLKKAVVKACVRQKVPVFPGAYTPTEIYKAWELGASMVKVFPAGQLGAGYIKEVLAPLNQLKLMPTGGINQENFTEYLKAGASGLGMGSHLIPKQLVAQEQWGQLHEHLAGFVEKYHHYQQQYS